MINSLFEQGRAVLHKENELAKRSEDDDYEPHTAHDERPRPGGECEKAVARSSKRLRIRQGM